MADYFQHTHALVAPGAKIGKQTRVWAFANVQDGAVIGEHCNIADGCFVEKGARIGNHVTLKNHVCVWDGVVIEDDVFVAAGTTFINDRYPRSNRIDQWKLEKITVKKGASIGANATIMCGVTIGEYAVIGAGSVITKDIAEHTIVIGSPARFAGYACRCGRKLDPSLNCSCGLTYQIQEGVLRST